MLRCRENDENLGDCKIIHFLLTITNPTELLTLCRYLCGGTAATL